MRPAVCRFAQVAVALLVLAGAHLVAPSAATAQENDPGSGGLELIAQSLGTGPAGTFTINLRLPGIIAKDDVLSLSIHEPVEDEDEFLASTQRQLGGVLHSRSAPLETLTVGPFGGTEVLIDLNDGSLGAIEPGQVRLVRPGVYPISIDLRTADQDLVGSIVTYLVRTPDPPFEGIPAPPELGVVILHDLHAEPTGALSADLKAVVAILADSSLPGTMTVTPQVVDRLLASNLDSVGARGTSWQIPTAPYLRIDEAALTAAGLNDEIDSLYEEGIDTIRRLTEPAPETLWVARAIDEELMRVRWNRGVRDLVVSAEHVDVVPPGRPRGPVELLTEVGAVRTLIADDDLLVHATEADPVLAAYRTLAHLSVISITAVRDQTVVLDLASNSRIQGPNSVIFDQQLIDGIERLTLVSVLPATEAIQRPRSIDSTSGRFYTATLNNDTRTERVDYTGYREARDLLSSFRSMVDDADAGDAIGLAEELRDSLSIDVTPSTRNNVWSRTASYVRSEVSRLDPPPLESISLTSREALVPFSFQNRANYPVRVEVRIISDKLRIADFDDGESTTLVLQPGITTREFTLRAQTSGSFPIIIELLSPDGGLELGETRTSVRATAPTGVGFALTLSAAAFLIAWWMFDIVRRRRKARA